MRVELQTDLPVKLSFGRAACSPTLQGVNSHLFPNPARPSAILRQCITNDKWPRSSSSLFWVRQVEGTKCIWLEVSSITLRGKVKVICHVLFAFLLANLDISYVFAGI